MGSSKSLRSAPFTLIEPEGAVTLSDVMARPNKLLNAMTDEIATYGRATYEGGMANERSEGDTHATT